jgi:hypothetical protein
MSSTREIEYKGRKVKITVSMATGGKQVGTFIVAGTDPLVRGTGADSDNADTALRNAENKAKEMIDRLP